MAEVKNRIDELDSDEIIVFTTDYIFELTEEVKNFFLHFGFDGNVFDQALAHDWSRRFSQIAGVFNVKGQRDLIYVTPNMETGQAHNGLKGKCSKLRFLSKISMFSRNFDKILFDQYFDKHRYFLIKILINLVY